MERADRGRCGRTRPLEPARAPARTQLLFAIGLKSAHHLRAGPSSAWAALARLPRGPEGLSSTRPLVRIRIGALLKPARDSAARRARQSAGTVARLAEALLLGSAAIVLCTTVAISVAALGVVSTIAADFALAGKPLDSAYLTPAKAGAAQTFLVIGDDHIGPTTTYSTGAEQTVNGYHYLHADTSCSAHGSDAGQTSILRSRATARELQLEGPVLHREVQLDLLDRGPRLVKKVALQTLPGLTINHVIDFNFASFIGLVDAIGCVYVDVDHRYLNDTDHSYQLINIQPGYQRLCSDRRCLCALPPYRLRLRARRAPAGLHPPGQGAARRVGLSQQVEPARASVRQGGLDRHPGTSEVAELLQLAAFSQSKPIRQVPFKVSNPNYRSRPRRDPGHGALDADR